MKWFVVKEEPKGHGIGILGTDAIWKYSTAGPFWWSEDKEDALRHAQDEREDARLGKIDKGCKFFVRGEQWVQSRLIAATLEGKELIPGPVLRPILMATFDAKTISVAPPAPVGFFNQSKFGKKRKPK